MSRNTENTRKMHIFRICWRRQSYKQTLYRHPKNLHLSRITRIPTQIQRKRSCLARAHFGIDASRRYLFGRHSFFFSPIRRFRLGAPRQARSCCFQKKKEKREAHRRRPTPIPAQKGLPCRTTTSIAMRGAKRFPPMHGAPGPTACCGYSTTSQRRGYSAHSKTEERLALLRLRAVVSSMPSTRAHRDLFRPMVRQRCLTCACAPSCRSPW